MGADAKITDNNLNTPLHIATIEGNFELVNTIVGFNMDANMVDKDGGILLYYACEIGYYNIVRALVDAGADLTIKDRGAKTAFELAWDDEIKQYLTEKLS